MCFANPNPGSSTPPSLANRVPCPQSIRNNDTCGGRTIVIDHFSSVVRFESSLMFAPKTRSPTQRPTGPPSIAPTSQPTSGCSATRVGHACSTDKDCQDPECASCYKGNCVPPYLIQDGTVVRQSLRSQTIALRALGKGAHKQADILNLFGGAQMIGLQCTPGGLLVGIYSCWASHGHGLNQRPCAKTILEKINTCNSLPKVQLSDALLKKSKKSIQP
jgi:hypothetical protein